MFRAFDDKMVDRSIEGQKKPSPSVNRFDLMVSSNRDDILVFCEFRF